MPDDIAAIWERAHRWLAAHSAEVSRRLRPGATTEMMARAEGAIGRALPDDVRASYQIHDGQVRFTSPLFAGHSLLSLEGVVGMWRMNAELIQEEGEMDGQARGSPPGAVRSVWRSRAWVPVATDENGNQIVVDLEPGPGGVSGQVVLAYAKHPDRPRVATSFTEFLDERIADWETGRAAVDEEDGEFLGFSSRPPWRER